MQYPGRIVRTGERDAAIVREVKLRLNEVMGLGGSTELRLDPDDPNYGPKMVSAVKLFQTRNVDADGGPLEVTGEVDPRTWAELFGAETVPASDKAEDPFLAKVLEVAAGEEAQHVREVPPASNRGPKVETYLSSVDLPPGKPWCCAFAYYCVNQAAKALGAATPMVRTGGCLDLWQRSAVKGAKLIPASAARENPALVKPGMIFIVDHGEGLGHTGFVERVGAGLITTIEGNTNPAKSREGGGVFRLVRRISEINKGFIDISPAAAVAGRGSAAGATAASVAAPPLCFKLGSKGDEVRKIQEKLKEKGLYAGPLDGAFGGGTLAAVKRYQCGEGLDADGVVGPQTWQALFQEQAGELPLAGAPLQQRCLALTGAFETDASFPDCFAGISGDFDGQGMSFGVLQQNLGQGTLQPLLNDMLRDHRDVVEGIFGGKLCVLEEMLNGDREEMMAFARSIQHPVKHIVNEPWKGMFKALGRTDEYQQIELRYARRLYNDAVSLVEEYGLWSERAVAMMFDIKVQNGSIGKVVKQRILERFCELGEGAAPEEREVTRMTIIANLRAEAANPRWVGDVRSRKLCCANGSGSVHGIFYTLHDQFGIGLTRYSP